MDYEKQQTRQQHALEKNIKILVSSVINHDLEKEGSKVFPCNDIWIGNQQFLPLSLKFPRFYAISKQINALAL